MPKKATELQKRAAKRMYEEDGETQAAIARHFGYSSPTVGHWVKDGGWVKAGSVTETGTAPAVGTFTEPEPEPERYSAPASPPPPPPTVSSDDELRNQVRRLEARNAELQDENKALKPTYDLGGMFTDRVQWLTDNSPEGEKYWINRAEAQFKKENRQRAKDGLPPFDINQHPAILEDLMIELKTKEVADAARPPTSPPSRKVKMFILRNGMPTIEQIPMESQVNNMAGSLADGIVRYTQKGFKLTDPFLCPRAGCFRPAGMDEFKRWQFDGYCTEQHRIEVEGEEKSPTTGLQTRDTILSGIG